jgi:hypothetical protein
MRCRTTATGTTSDSCLVWRAHLAAAGGVASQERGVRGSAPATSALATDHVFSKRSCVTCCQLCLAADRLLRWVVVVMLGEALGIWHRRAVHGGDRCVDHRRRNASALVATDVCSQYRGGRAAVQFSWGWCGRAPARTASAARNGRARNWLARATGRVVGGGRRRPLLPRHPVG